MNKSTRNGRGSGVRTMLAIRDRVLVRMLLSGISHEEICQQTGLKRSTFLRRIRSDEFNQLLEAETPIIFAHADRMIRTAHLRAARELNRAIRKLGKMLRSENPRLQLEAIDRLIEITQVGRGNGKGLPSTAPPAASVTNNTQVNLLAADPEARMLTMKLVEKHAEYQRAGANAEG